MAIGSSETITLVVVSDDHYMILLAALIKSIEKNLKAGVRIDVWIIEDDIKEGSKKKMNASVDPAVTSLYWKNIHEVFKNIHLPKDRSSYPLNIYARLLIPDLIPENVEKVLYLDVDMIVLTDISELWNTDISQYVLAAVTDPRVQTFDNHWGGILNYRQLGLDGTSKYFNTGVLLINNNKWRENRITEQIFGIINGNVKYANYPDQYGLNIAVANKWLELPQHWNHFSTIPSDGTCIIHFIGRKPMYKAYKNSNIFRDYFYTYLNETAWKHAKPIGEMKRRLKKIGNIMSKIMRPS